MLYYKINNCTIISVNHCTVFTYSADKVEPSFWTLSFPRQLPSVITLNCKQNDNYYGMSLLYWGLSIQILQTQFSTLFVLFFFFWANSLPKTTVARHIIKNKYAAKYKWTHTRKQQKRRVEVLNKQCCNFCATKENRAQMGNAYEKGALGKIENASEIQMPRAKRKPLVSSLLAIFTLPENCITNFNLKRKGKMI